ncbi:MAG: exodeoxyribonuclease III [Bacilli bacterium]|nr:exodeoxyribonuclease III [Bacilli bacterium]
MRIVTWNVNGIRAVVGKGFAESIESLNPDVLVLQETKLSLEGELAFPYAKEGYRYYGTISKLRKGYSGVSILTRVKPLSVHYGLLDEKYDEEGRVITLEFDSFYLVGAYVPNSGDGLKRLDFRMGYEKDLIDYFAYLEKSKPIVYCGDLNVAHNDIDLKNPESNHKNPGFTDEEREAFTKLLGQGYIDIYRTRNPDIVKYSWWSYRFHARENNAGWRIDYFLCSTRFYDKVEDIEIHNEIFGSDHCPVSLDLRN